MLLWRLVLQCSALCGHVEINDIVLPELGGMVDGSTHLPHSVLSAARHAHAMYGKSLVSVPGLVDTDSMYHECMKGLERLEATEPHMIPGMKFVKSANVLDALGGAAAKSSQVQPWLWSDEDGGGNGLLIPGWNVADLSHCSAEALDVASIFDTINVINEFEHDSAKVGVIGERVEQLLWKWSGQLEKEDGGSARPTADTPASPTNGASEHVKGLKGGREVRIVRDHFPTYLPLLSSLEVFLINSAVRTSQVESSDDRLRAPQKVRLAMNLVHAMRGSKTSCAIAARLMALATILREESGSTLGPSEKHVVAGMLASADRGLELDHIRGVCATAEYKTSARDVAQSDKQGILFNQLYSAQQVMLSSVGLLGHGMSSGHAERAAQNVTSAIVGQAPINGIVAGQLLPWCMAPTSTPRPRTCVYDATIILPRIT